MRTFMTDEFNQLLSQLERVTLYLIKSKKQYDMAKEKNLESCIVDYFENKNEVYAFVRNELFKQMGYVYQESKDMSDKMIEQKRKELFNNIVTVLPKYSNLQEYEIIKNGLIKQDILDDLLDYTNSKKNILNNFLDINSEYMLSYKTKKQDIKKYINAENNLINAIVKFLPEYESKRNQLLKDGEMLDEPKRKMFNILNNIRKETNEIWDNYNAFVMYYLVKEEAKDFNVLASDIYNKVNEFGVKAFYNLLTTEKDSEVAIWPIQEIYLNANKILIETEKSLKKELDRLNVKSIINRKNENLEQRKTEIKKELDNIKNGNYIYCEILNAAKGIFLRSTQITNDVKWNESILIMKNKIEEYLNFIPKDIRKNKVEQDDIIVNTEQLVEILDLAKLSNLTIVPALVLAKQLNIDLQLPIQYYENYSKPLTKQLIQDMENMEKMKGVVLNELRDKNISMEDRKLKEKFVEKIDCYKNSLSALKIESPVGYLQFNEDVKLVDNNLNMVNIEKIDTKKVNMVK